MKKTTKKSAVKVAGETVKINKDLQATKAPWSDIAGKFATHITKVFNVKFDASLLNALGSKQMVTVLYVIISTLHNNKLRHNPDWGFFQYIVLNCLHYAKQCASTAGKGYTVDFKNSFCGIYYKSAIKGFSGESAKHAKWVNATVRKISLFTLDTAIDLYATAEGKSRKEIIDSMKANVGIAKELGLETDTIKGMLMKLTA